MRIRKGLIWLKRLIFLLLLLINVFIFALNSEVLGFENSLLVDIAKKYVGRKFDEINGQCKQFVKMVVKQAGGSLGVGYRFCYLEVGKEVSAKEATTGDLIQLDTEKNHNLKIDKGSNNYTWPMHTAIIVKNLGNGNFEIIESNREKPLTVTTGKWNPYKQAGKKLHVHFYRLGRISNNREIPSQPLPNPKPIPVKNVTIALIIDDSASMMYNDPQYQRKAASRYLIDLLSNGDRIILIRIADNESLLYEMKQIKNQADREFLKNKIQLYANTATNIDAALSLAKKQLEGIEGKIAMIIVTDGAHMPANRAPYKETHKTLSCPVYTILLKPKNPVNYASLVAIPQDIKGYIPDPEFLSRIAKDTGGSFKESPKPENLQAIYQEITENIQGKIGVFDKTLQMMPQQTVEEGFNVSLKTTEISGSISWPGSKIKTILISPSGKIYNPEVTTENYEVFRITNPEIGNWKFSSQAIAVSPTGEPVNFHFSAKIDEEPPKVSILSPKDISLVKNINKIKVKATDNIELRNVVFYADNRKIGEGNLTRNNLWEINWKFKKSGEHLLKAVAFDIKKNSNFDEVFVVIDSQKPEISKIKIKAPTFWNKKTLISYKVNDAYSFPIRTWIQIRNNEGQLIKDYKEMNVFSEKKIKLFWDNKNEENNFVPTASYEISIYAQDRLGNVEITRKKIRILTIPSIFVSIKNLL